MIALSGWSLIAAALAAVAAVVALSRVTHIPRHVAPPPDASVGERLAAIEAYLIQSQQAWRSSTRRYQVLLGVLVACVILAVASFQDDRDHDRKQFRIYTESSCQTIRESRQALQDRDARDIARAQSALDRHDAASERALQLEELPPDLVPVDLVPLLKFLAVDATERRAAERAELERDLSAARRDAAEYAARAPVPTCGED